ncbi:MAG: hypothetical protein U0795_08600 [Pirellulales bacterium]
MVRVSREQFLSDRQGRTFGDVLEDPDQPFGDVLAFFNDPDRQRRMDESEIHHNRPPLAGVIRELEAQPSIDRFFRSLHPQSSLRLRQAIGVLVRMIMERRGWRKTGHKGSLGVRAAENTAQPRHNSGGLALWFIRAERYVLDAGMPFTSVKKRQGELNSGSDGKQNGKRTTRKTTRGKGRRS